MYAPNSIIITKEANGNITVTNEGQPFTLLSQSFLTKQLNSVIIRGTDDSIIEFFVSEVLKVVNDAVSPSEVFINDADTLFNELNDFFFFNAVGNVIPSGALCSVEIIQTLSGGNNTVTHNIGGQVIGFNVLDGTDFVQTEGNIIDNNNFNVFLSGGSITNAKIIFIYIK